MHFLFGTTRFKRPSRGFSDIRSSCSPPGGDPDRQTSTVRATSKKTTSLVVALAVGAMLATTFASPRVTAAAGWCDGNVGNYFSGWGGTEGSIKIEGVSASLTYRTADVCLFGGGNFDTGWTMVAGAYWYQYAQSGFLFDGNPLGCMRHFAQQSNSATSFTTKTGSCTSDGEVHRAWQQYLPNTGGHIRSNIDSTVFLESTWNELNWAHPWSAEFYGETGNMQGDIPGLSTRKTDWSSMTIQYYTDNVYRGTCGRITLFRNVDNGRWGADAPNCDHVRAWTQTR